MEIPSYTQDDYAHHFLEGYSIFPDDSRIFHRGGYQYDYLAGLTTVQVEANRVSFSGIFASGAQGHLSLETVTPEILRIRLWKADAAFDEQSPMLLPLPQVRPDLQVEDGDAACQLHSGGYRIILEKSPFCLKVISPQGETIFESETELLVSRLTAPPMGFRRQQGDPSAGDWAFMSWRSRNQDRYYGLGEKFTKFEKTSSRATIWEEDTCGSNTSDMSYKAVPVLFSTAGWGMMLHSSFRSYWEIGTLSYATASLMVEDGKLDLFLMLAPDLKGLIQRYTGLTGRSPMVPKSWLPGEDSRWRHFAAGIRPGGRNRRFHQSAGENLVAGQAQASAEPGSFIIQSRFWRPRARERPVS
jgi:alpha-D-xyloside xylohydrolase